MFLLYDIQSRNFEDPLDYAWGLAANEIPEAIH